MVSSFALSNSENALLIELEKFTLEDIVEKKLLYFFSEKKSFFEKDVFKKFYTPVEQAVVEMALEKHSGNQLKTADFLGINRNTLKKKINLYKLDIKNLLLQKKDRTYPVSRLFISSPSSLDLLSASRSKLSWAKAHQQIPSEKVLKQLCSPVEKRIVQTALGQCKGNQIRTSRLLGLNRNTLKKKLNDNLKNMKACL